MWQRLKSITRRDVVNAVLEFAGEVVAMLWPPCESINGQSTPIGFVRALRLVKRGLSIIIRLFRT